MKRHEVRWSLVSLLTRIKSLTIQKVLPMITVSWTASGEFLVFAKVEASPVEICLRDLRNGILPCLSQMVTIPVSLKLTILEPN